MGSIIDKIRSGPEEAGDLPKASLRNEDVTEKSSDTVIYTTTVSKNTDLLAVKDQLYENNIVIIEINNEEYSLDRERVFEELQNTTDDVNGDIALVDESTVIVSPDRTHISRQSL
jgi:SepF-like predicted cell division protein (DUF552 family)